MIDVDRSTLGELCQKMVILVSSIPQNCQIQTEFRKNNIKQLPEIDAI